MQDAWQQKSFGAAGLQLEASVKVHGMDFVESLAPIPNVNKADLWAAGLTSMTRKRPRNRPAASTYNIVAYFEDEDAISRLAMDRRHEVIGVYVDLEIEPAALGTYQGSAAVGGETDVQGLANVPLLSSHGLTGRGVHIVVMDSGIDQNFVPVSEQGWAPADIAYQPGTADAHDPWFGHGTMCAHDARLIAPLATFHDYAVLRRKGAKLPDYLSDVANAYAHLIDQIDADGPWAGHPVVVNNSWVVYKRSEDLPVGAPGNYSANLNHPVNQYIGTVVSLGADVIFAAGNCGKPRPDTRCGLSDFGPGNSIHGGAAHPDVITVAGVTTDGRRLAYSSQGPGSISSRKPDVAACTHFATSSAWPKHSGTSAAAPVLAGIVAAIRTRGAARGKSPADLRALLQRTARNPLGSGWNQELGFGIVDVAATLEALGMTAPATETVIVTARRKRVSRPVRTRKSVKAAQRKATKRPKKKRVPKRSK
ncbi:MAG TPA: S8 family serine peptidase [Steroidobacter sp.]